MKKVDEQTQPMNDEVTIQQNTTPVQQPSTTEKATLGDKEEKELVAKTMFVVLFDTIKMLSVICPYITEAIYQNFKESIVFS